MEEDRDIGSEEYSDPKQAVIEMASEDDYEYTPESTYYDEQNQIAEYTRHNQLARQSETRKMRINIPMAWALITSALLVDLAEMGITWIGLIIIGGLLSTALSGTASFGFGVWLKCLGVSVSGNTKAVAKQLLLSMSVVIVEFIPAFDAVPLLSWGWTIGMYFTIAFARMEDRGENPSFIGALGEMATFASPAAIVTRGATKIVSRGVKRLARSAESPFSLSVTPQKEPKTNMLLQTKTAASPQNVLNLKKAA